MKKLLIGMVLCLGLCGTALGQADAFAQHTQGKPGEATAIVQVQGGLTSPDPLDKERKRVQELQERIRSLSAGSWKKIEVHLNGGKRIVGNVVEVEETEVVLQLGKAKSLRVAYRDISEVARARKFEEKFLDGMVITGLILLVLATLPVSMFFVCRC